jgi:hypothetical protein
VLTDAAQAPVGTRLRLQLAQGELACRVEGEGGADPAPPEAPAGARPRRSRTRPPSA